MSLLDHGEEFQGRSYFGRFDKDKDGSSNMELSSLPCAFGLVESAIYSTVPKSVHFPSFLGLLENWDQHVTFAWKGESWCSMPLMPPPQCPVVPLDTGVLGKQKVSRPGSSFAGLVYKEQFFQYRWSFMILLGFSMYDLI